MEQGEVSKEVAACQVVKGWAGRVKGEGKVASKKLTLARGQEPSSKTNDS